MYRVRVYKKTKSCPLIANAPKRGDKKRLTGLNNPSYNIIIVLSRTYTTLRHVLAVGQLGCWGHPYIATKHGIMEQPRDLLTAHPQSTSLRVLLKPPESRQNRTLAPGVKGFIGKTTLVMPERAFPLCFCRDRFLNGCPPNPGENKVAPGTAKKISPSNRQSHFQFGNKNPKSQRITLFAARGSA